MKWYSQVLKNYANFNGRARRKEYWMFVLFNFIFTLITLAIDAAIMYQFSFFIPVLTIAYSLAMMIPSIAVAIRRLHDVGKSGGYFLLAFLPIANIYYIILLLTAGEPNKNMFGEDPKNEKEFSSYDNIVSEA
ncbi:DUF805 domain-containing protein [Mangrovivirga cuniculi]|uniref:DUF805 domain-containing protein n=1 Tax=Mangrovivirga cuniculi TaxID=2715131 RepID=A0A4D7JLI9_9BACT|nr:DUF805 domain-containing protein [Mangrovivirga cuniculi]QCK16729.1 DUF805 domain-containing protein [Mangrovivirga cuniculi]